MATTPQGRFEPGQALRVGLRQHPLTDLYYQLMRRSWALLVAFLVGFYLLANLAFAVLYLADMPGITRTQDGGFTDAFAFSVQTISTIGYGTMSPNSPYAHALVTAEAMVGVLGFAIATGLMFQKFARPRAMVQFSKIMVVSVREGKPVLMLRIGNTRGNEIIEASIRVTMLLPEVTSDGHQLRRLHDCKLVRANTPMFVMTWLVMHDVDPSSPMWNQSPESLVENNAMWIVTLTGIDATFSQTIHARHIYYAEHVRIGERFADVISFNEDGRPVIDYTRFDETSADPAGLDALPLMRP